jgi:glycosyltransferase involved in cell wall biosynthesis
MLSIGPGVLIVCPIYAPHAGGGGQYFPLLAQQIKSYPGVREVAVITERHPERPSYVLEHGVHLYRLLPQRDSLERKSWFYSIWSFVWTYVLLYFWIPALMRKHRVGMLHYTRYLRRAFYLLAWTLRSIFRKIIILDMRATVENSECIRRLFGVSAVISNSMSVYRQMANLGVPKEKHFFVPNPVHLPKPMRIGEAWRVVSSISPRVRRPYLVFVGQLLQRKSIIEVLDAFALFSRGQPEYQLILAGRNMMGSMLERKISETPNVLHLGAVKHDQALALMQESDMVLQPSRVEGIPRVSLEALALGKKTLLPPCVPEFVERNETFTVSEVTAQSVSEAMVRILCTPNGPSYDLFIHDPDRSMSVLYSVYDKVRR